MLRSFTTILIISALLAISVSTPAVGQIGSSVTAETHRLRRQTADKPDLKQVIAREEAKLKAESSRFDPVKAEKESRKQATRSNLTKKEKTFLVLFAVGIAAIVFFVIKYGKDCIRSSPPGCTPGVDDGCVCEEYSQNR